MSEKTKPKKWDDSKVPIPEESVVGPLAQGRLLEAILAELRAIREQLKTEVVIRDKHR